MKSKKPILSPSAAWLEVNKSLSAAERVAFARSVCSDPEHWKRLSEHKRYYFDGDYVEYIGDKQKEDPKAGA